MIFDQAAVTDKVARPCRSIVHEAGAIGRRNSAPDVVLSFLDLRIGSGRKTVYRVLYAPYGTGHFPDTFDNDAGHVFSPPLFKAIRVDQQAARGEMGRLDEDPFRGCQDDDGFRLKTIVERSVSRRRATVVVTFGLGTDAAVRVRQRVTLDLVMMSGAWRIADIHGREVPSLLAFLTRR